ncbi:MAG TPA: malto-oligosyltrehalose synthase, partial [Gemmatimonadaceae bacterium]
MSSSLALDPRRPLTSTYRLQMNAGFTLDHARARLDYFEQLGVSHLYLSPIFAARRGSQHGYDVVDPARINPELGTEADLRALADDLHGRSMGLIVDIVPNHMAIGDENRYWDDVLTHGERSRYARWFDIDWSWPLDDTRQRKLVLPILGNDLDRVLACGELSVRLREGETPRIVYATHSFPLDPDSLPPDLQLAQVDPEETGDLAKLYSGIAGRDRLSRLLEVQHYRLVSWRRGRTTINYRRFFDVNELAAVRVEDPTVFDETHALVLRLVHDGVIDGLRIDHVDGLLDPAVYLERLRAATSPETAIFVEKILAPDECLPDTWPVQGTTGYEFLNDVENVFLDAVGTPQVERFYRRLRRLGATTFADIARDAKTRVLEESLRADVDRVAVLLVPMARAAGHGWNADGLAAALIAFVAALPVYRTYIDETSPLTPADRSAIERAAADAIRHDGQDEIVAFIASVLLDESLTGDAAMARVQFAQRVQQLSGPAAARGVEDTALYVYVPVISRDEVGSEPDRPVGGAVDRLH